VLGDIVRLRRSRDEVPSQEELSKESDVKKKLCLQWDRLEVVNEVVYRRLPGSKLGEEDHLQLSVPKSRQKKVHIDKLKDFVGSPPLDWRSPSSGTTADENEVSDTRFATVGASSVSVAWPTSTAKDAGERWKELQGNVGAQSEGIPVEAVETPAEKKPPSYTVGSSDEFSSPL